jgi:NAD(P)-dependent dehydrogenase (short-subunit alcohol dehydrogenase family)
MGSASGDDLNGKRVLVTGGSSGIGLATAGRLADAGARVMLLARGERGLADAAEQISACAGTISADVSDAAAVSDAVERAVGLLGGLDVVVANAGAGAYGPFRELAVEDVERTIRITLLGMINTAHAALPHLERTGGVLVVVGSIAGRLPTPWLAGYAAAKHGVRGFVRSLECELRAQHSAVRLALVAPGPVDTPFWRRVPTPDGRLPPEIRGAYRADDVATEILRAISTPGRLERSLGGAMAIAALIDAFIPNLVLVALGAGARLGWRGREERPSSSADGLSQPTVKARRDGGLVSRPSILTRVRTVSDLLSLPRPGAR